MRLLDWLRCRLGKHDGQWFEIYGSRDKIVLVTRCWRCGAHESTRTLAGKSLTHY